MQLKADGLLCMCGRIGSFGLDKGATSRSSWQDSVSSSAGAACVAETGGDVCMYSCVSERDSDFV